MSDHDLECCAVVDGPLSASMMARHRKCEVKMCRRCLTCIRHYMHGSAQREGFKELWDTWIERWGRVRAADALLIAMCEYEAKYQDLKRLVEERKRRKNAHKRTGGKVRSSDGRGERSYRGARSVPPIDDGHPSSSKGRSVPD